MFPVGAARLLDRTRVMGTVQRGEPPQKMEENMEFHVLIRVMRGVYRNNPPLWLRNVAPQTVKPWGTPLFFSLFPGRAYLHSGEGFLGAVISPNQDTST